MLNPEDRVEYGLITQKDGEGKLKRDVGGRGSLEAESRVWKTKATVAVKILKHTDRISRAKNKWSRELRNTE